MKKTVLHLILFCLLATPLMAQPGKHPGVAEGKTGRDPAAMLRSQVSPGDPDVTLGYKPAPFRIEFPARAAGDRRYKSSAALPSKFDLRDEGRVTPAKDQGGGNYGGNCTSFSTIGAIESRWLSMGFGEIDLSEQNMAACNGFDEENWGYGQGANQFICSAYLTRFDGPVLEEDDPYNLSLHICRSDIVELDLVALVPESRWLPVRDFDLLKRTIYYYGAVYAGIHWDVTGESFNAADNTYYYDGSNDANHAVLVCGWDDDMGTAGGTGAWIVKNSWGTEWADNGFFYIAYQDTRFAADEVACFPVRWETEDVDTAFIYDNLGFTAKFPATNAQKVYELAKFTASSQQLITHVGVCVPDPKTVLDFHVYGNFAGNELSNLLASREGLYIEVPGIYTFELPFTADGDFFIRVAREVGIGDVNHPVETFDEGFSDPVIEPNVNWIRRESAEEWTASDFASTGLDFNLTIRAYATYSAAPQALFMADKKEACLGSQVTYTYLENNPATTYEWDFGQDASPPTASTAGPHQVSYSTEGTKTISLIVSGAGGSDTVTRHDYIDVVPDISVNILRDSMAFQQGQTVEVSAYGADSYVWSPASLVDNTTGQSVMVTPPFEGTHVLYVSGSQGSCSDMDSIIILTINKPANDDMCDAMLIDEGGFIGSFSNEFATAEENEPAPDDIDCYGAMTWCVDDWGETVTNSLWFYFFGPETGIAQIRTSGFDNQIAVYRADDCTNITKDDLIAANDDYSPPPNEELAATLGGITVNPGDKYYLQVDGSFGGVTGTFDLYFLSWAVGIENPESPGSGGASLLVYPNPGRDIFSIRLEGASASEVEVMLYNLNGQLIVQKSYSGVPGDLFTRLDLSDQPGGVYHLRVIDGNRIINRKIIKE